MERSRGFKPTAVAVLAAFIAVIFFFAGYTMHTVSVARAASAVPTGSPGNDGDPSGLTMQGQAQAQLVTPRAKLGASNPCGKSGACPVSLNLVANKNAAPPGAPTCPVTSHSSCYAFKGARLTVTITDSHGTTLAVPWFVSGTLSHNP